MLSIFLLEQADSFLNLIAFRLTAHAFMERALHQARHAISDKIGNAGFREWLQVHARQSEIDGAGEIGSRVDQRAIQIKKKKAACVRWQCRLAPQEHEDVSQLRQYERFHRQFACPRAAWQAKYYFSFKRSGQSAGQHGSAFDLRITEQHEERIETGQHLVEHALDSLNGNVQRRQARAAGSDDGMNFFVSYYLSQRGSQNVAIVGNDLPDKNLMPLGFQ
jgi:hypothetical protein